MSILWIKTFFYEKWRNKKLVDELVEKYVLDSNIVEIFKNKVITANKEFVEQIVNLEKIKEEYLD